MTVKRKFLLIVVCIVFLGLLLWVLWGNTALECTTYTLTDEHIPVSFDGYRIAHVSDLHNCAIGKNNNRLLSALEKAQPDMIAITGDLIDSRSTDISVALQFAAQAVKLAPCYYVSGNHEARTSQYSALKEGLTDLGVTVLEDDSVQLQHEGETVRLLGVRDPSFRTDYLFGSSETVMDSALEQLTDDRFYTILLSHRPELFDIYAKHSINLVLSGHAHGGQFRLPFVGGLFAPNQGLFPKYDAGLYTQKNTCMLVSKGIGRSIIPLRFNNRPEVILVDLAYSGS